MIMEDLQDWDDAGHHASALWIDESSITLCQRARLQRGRTSFFIVLVPMIGPPTRE